MIPGFLLAIIGTLLFSLKSIFIKFLYIEGLDADSVLVLRMALSLPIYIGILIWLRSQSNVSNKLNSTRMFTIFALVLTFTLRKKLALKAWN